MASPERILVADDDETPLLSTADLLRREGYDCVTADHAGAAIAALAADPCDLLLADICMPGNADLELVQHLTRIIHES
ncbi:response regulator [bacterium]|nr:response regulator [bacterium]